MVSGVSIGPMHTIHSPIEFSTMPWSAHVDLMVVVVVVVVVVELSTQTIFRYTIFAKVRS